MSKIQFHYISWQELHHLCFELLKKVKKEKLEFDRIVCISRGGLVVARIFSDFLDLPISNFTIVSYASVGKIGKPKVMEALAANIKKERVLLIDEIIDSGMTLKKAISYLEKKEPQKIITLVPVIKPWTKLKPDFWQIETKEWVVFGYEVRETIDDVVKIWKKDGRKREEIKKGLIKIDLPKEQVEYFFNKDKIK
jgi:hypoxanthine phosphoribosyltransferase